MHDVLNILFWAAVIAVAVWVWHKFLRTRCPNCKSTQFSELSRDMIDYSAKTEHKTEIINSNNGNVPAGGGGIRELRYSRDVVSKKFRISLRCKPCGNEWGTVRKVVERSEWSRTGSKNPDAMKLNHRSWLGPPRLFSAPT
jgi:ribosomal protein L44E